MLFSRRAQPVREHPPHKLQQFLPLVNKLKPPPLGRLTKPVVNILPKQLDFHSLPTTPPATFVAESRRVLVRLTQDWN